MATPKDAQKQVTEWMLLHASAPIFDVTLLITAAHRRAVAEGELPGQLPPPPEDKNDAI
jgi:hypothetical protein